MLDYRGRGRLRDRLSRNPKREPLTLSRDTVHDDMIAVIADICLIRKEIPRAWIERGA